jgi:5,10-methylenetetrahydromethanopterin reductase
MTGSRQVQFGICGYYNDLTEYLAWLRLAEGLGYDLVGYGDTQNLIPDVYVGLTAMALETTRIKLCSTVTNPVTRHPAVTASAMAAVQKLSGGRTICGIGTGDSALLNIGERPATVDEIEEYCVAFKGLCAGEEVSWRGHEFKLQWEAEPVPLFIAAEGPRMMHLAGRIADGVIFANGVSEDVIRDNVRRVSEGARFAGRDPSEIELWFFAKPYFAESEEQAWREVAWTLAASANHAFRFSLEGKFVPEEHREGVRNLQREYASHEHNKKDAGAHNASLVEKNGLSEFLGRRFLIAGTPDRIVERIREMAGHGATNLICTAIFDDQAGYTRRLAEEVVSAFRS